ncbi:Rne/Rng family ribonuclease [Thioalkalivibrio sp. HK1]|uniref:Rne/Rng family ribonuclease n=1 Tax=Thioalkalivibrio sp. HK1 TaxID=1469245 RepID=UPI000470F8F5|nr:ribonuclease E/G [Thioalkalivibrio sp. HK1]
MSIELLVNITSPEVRVALVEKGVLQEIFIEQRGKRGLVGNIYKGRILRVLPGMQAAFVDIGLERSAFLHASDITSPSLPSLADIATIDGAILPAADDEDTPEIPIDSLVREGEERLVQVIKDPIGTKGARITTRFSIPSCHTVILPGSAMIGVSKRIEDESERHRLQAIVRDLIENGGRAEGAEIDGLSGSERKGSMPEDGWIVRTAAEGCSAQVIESDMLFLQRLLHSITAKGKAYRAPAIVHEDLPLVVRILRERSSAAIERVRIDSASALAHTIDFCDRFLPEMSPRIDLHDGDSSIFDLYSVENEIRKALHPRVPLKSGGSIVIEETEALIAIDVNSGGFVGRRNPEETAFKTNIEAVHAIARQLRLRNLAGIIVVDFIDMQRKEHRDALLKTLEKALSADRVRVRIGDISPLGLVEMTRKRTGKSLRHTLFDDCPHCRGSGAIKSAASVCNEIVRDILRNARQFDSEGLLIVACPEIGHRLIEDEYAIFSELEALTGKSIEIRIENRYTRERYDIVPL